MKGKIRIIAKFHRNDLVICSHSRGRKPPSYSRRNTVFGVWRILLTLEIPKGCQMLRLQNSKVIAAICTAT